MRVILRVNKKLTSVITTRSSVIYTRRVRFYIQCDFDRHDNTLKIDFYTQKTLSLAECGFHIHQSIFKTYVCESDIHESDNDTPECDLYTQSAIPYTAWLLQARMWLQHARVWYQDAQDWFLHTQCTIFTRRMWFFTRSRLISTRRMQFRHAKCNSARIIVIWKRMRVSMTRTRVILIRMRVI
jgi:hypothetical protein